MNKDQIEAILASIAKNNRTTVENVRKEIQLAMDVAQQSNDPNIQSLWHSIFAVLFSSGRDDEPTVFVFVL